MTRFFLASTLPLLTPLLLPGLARADGKFDTVSVHIERNATDKDSEVIVEAIGQDEGLVTLDVMAPNGRSAVSFKAAGSKLGMRHLMLETPEPKDSGKILADFPAGTYKFAGTTADGEKLHGQAVLSHQFPANPVIVRPNADAEDLPASGLVVSWNPIPDLSAWIVTVEDEKTAREIKVNLAASTTSFTIPDGFLAPGTEYKLGIGAVAKDGNASFVEADFTTAKP